MFGPVETADGYVMLAIASEKTFQSLVRVSGHPEWISDPRFAKYADRRDHWKDLMDGVETWSRTLPTRDCLAELNRCGVPASAYRTVAEALSDPQIAHRSALTEAEDGGGTFKVMNLPFRMSGASVTAGKRVATLGEHTATALREICRSEQKIAGFSGRPARAERRWRQGRLGDDGRPCGFSSGCNLRPCRSRPFQPIYRTVISDPEYRTNQSGRRLHDRGNPLAQACANIPCSGICCCVVCRRRERPKAGRQHHRRA